jgi:hypothetical protein
MPINESNRKSRDRWPLEFDLEGIPRDSGERKRLLEQREASMDPENFFAASQPVTDTVVDINNPPRNRNYNPHAPENQFPKMLYHHDSGQVLVVKSAAEQKAAEKKGFQLKPSPNRDYSKVKHGSLALVKDTTPNPSVPPDDIVSLSDDEMDAAEQELAAAQTEPRRKK